MPFSQFLPHQEYTKYWDHFYESLPVMPPSSCARYVAQYWMKPNSEFLELGCGSGRDSIWFSTLGHNVTGVDLSEKAIEVCRSQNSAAKFIQADFSNLQFDHLFDVIYSRFTLHSVNDATEAKTIQGVHRLLKPGGLFIVEARSIYDELFGLGTRMSEREWIHDDHYRRFLDLVVFLKNTKAVGLEPKFILMSKGLSPWKEFDPVALRIVFEKK